MPDISELLREELKRVTDQVQPEQLRPLRVPVRPPRRGLRLVQVAAGAAVLAIAVAALAVGTAAGHRPAGTATRSHVTIPRYYVAISQNVSSLQAVVRDSANGRITGAVTVPSADRPGVAAVTAAADGRSFIVGAYGGGPAGSSSYRLFLLRVSASGRPAPLSELLDIPLPVQGPSVEGIALSPDGASLAISLQYTEPSMDFIPYGGIEVVDLATRATRTWTAPHDDYFYWPGPPSWDGDTMIAFTWWHSIGPQGFIDASSTQVRELDTATAGSNLMDSLVIVPAGAVRGDIESALITPDGRDIIASTYRDSAASGGQRGTVVAQIVELTPGTGRLIRVLRTQAVRYAEPNQPATLNASSQLLALDADGENALVQCFGFGRLAVGPVGTGTFTALPAGQAGTGTFTALPAGQVETSQVAAAW